MVLVSSGQFHWTQTIPLCYNLVVSQYSIPNTFHIIFLGTTALCTMVSTGVMVQEPIERRGLDGQWVYHTKRLHPSWQRTLLEGKVGLDLHQLTSREAPPTSQWMFLEIIEISCVWYMCLKTCVLLLKICVKIRVSEKVYRNTWNIV